MVTSKINLKVKASTLVEVIVAMVILLVIFGIGMTIFANLFRNSSSLDKLAIQKQLMAVRQQYLDASLVAKEVTMEDIRYSIITKKMVNYPDIYSLKIFATRINDGSIVDSLISIHSITEGIHNDLDE